MAIADGPLKRERLGTELGLCGTVRGDSLSGGIVSVRGDPLSGGIVSSSEVTSSWDESVPLRSIA